MRTVLIACGNVKADLSCSQTLDAGKYKYVMFYRLHHFLKGPNPLHPNVWEGRLKPLTFRRLQVADIPHCLELHALNATDRFPKGGSAEYEACLMEQSAYFLVAEKDGQIVATGGLSYWMREDISVLCYGLVNPRHQGQGIGTALLLARLALLRPPDFSQRVFIFAVEKSIAFYRRFGFGKFKDWQDKQGKLHPSGQLSITRTEIRQCRALLRAHGIAYPPDQDQVPIRMDAT